MNQIVQFALLGVGSGSIYALLGLGMVVIYRGSGVINFAHAGFALIGAYTVYFLRGGSGAGPASGTDVLLPLAGAVVVGVVVGLLTQLLVLRPLRAASPLARVIATLGLLTILGQAVQLKYGPDQLTTAIPLPNKTVTLPHDIVVGRQSFYLLAIAIVFTLILTVTASRTRLGYAVSAAAENARGASALGWSPDLLAGITWATGGGLAALAGGLFPAITFGFISPTQFNVLIIFTLATALMGSFKSYPLALAGGLVIGIAQALTTHFTDRTGVPDSVPFLVIIVLLVVRGRGLPLRGTLTDRLPRVGTGRIRPLVVVPLAAIAIGFVALVAGDNWYVPVIISATFAIVGLSVVVLTGYTGQLSIAQFALAGVGAFAAGRLEAAHGWRFEPALLAGVLVAAAIGFLFGLPALRTRGVNLAVVTFGLGFSVYEVVFSNTKYTGGGTQTHPPNLSFFGIGIDPIDHQRRYAVMCLVALVLVGLVVANLRRGRAGRRLLAVRTNERAAAAIGVNVFEAKLFAFTFSAAVAGLGGVLFGFSYSTILYPNLFPPDSSIQVLVFTVIGSAGYVAGPLIGAVSAQGGIITLVFSGEGSSTNWIQLALGVLLVVTLILNQNGVAERLDFVTQPLRARRAGKRRTPVPLPAATRVRLPARTLVVSGLTQRFGGFVALDDVGLSVGPGEVVGLLGPNGAGKTTLIDCVSGNNRLTAGTITYDGKDITRWAPYRRARAGLSRSFQSLELFDDLTVRENLLAAADPRDRAAYLTDLLRPGHPPLPAQVVAAVEELGLQPLLDGRAEDLSYGQRRLVAIARAVATSPSVLLLDEPAAGLDETESAELGRLIRRLADEWGIGILLIEHDVALVLAHADRVVVLDFGHKIAEGTPSEIRADKGVRKAYLGEEIETPA